MLAHDSVEQRITRYRMYESGARLIVQEGLADSFREYFVPTTASYDQPM